MCNCNYNIHRYRPETFHNDIYKVVDMLLLGKDKFLKSYSYLSEDDYYKTMKHILYDLFTYEQRYEYYEYLIDKVQLKYANKIVRL